jgi:hypothetical protein
LSEHTFGFQRYKKSFLVSAKFMDSIENLFFVRPQYCPPFPPPNPLHATAVNATTIAAAAATVAATVHKTHRQ